MTTPCNRYYLKLIFLFFTFLVQRLVKNPILSQNFNFVTKFLKNFLQTGPYLLPYLPVVVNYESRSVALTLLVSSLPVLKLFLECVKTSQTWKRKMFVYSKTIKFCTKISNGSSVLHWVPSLRVRDSAWWWRKGREVGVCTNWNGWTVSGRGVGRVDIGTGERKWGRESGLDHRRVDTNIGHQTYSG